MSSSLVALEAKKKCAKCKHLVQLDIPLAVRSFCSVRLLSKQTFFFRTAAPCRKDAADDLFHSEDVEKLEEQRVEVELEMRMFE